MFEKAFDSYSALVLDNFLDRKAYCPSTIIVDLEKTDLKPDFDVGKEVCYETTAFPSSPACYKKFEVGF